MDNTSHEANTGGVPNRGSLYAVAAAYSKEAIDTLYDIMKNSKNEGIRLGAAKAILNKSLPDLKQSEGFDSVPDERHELSPEFAEFLKNSFYKEKAENKKMELAEY